MRGKGNKDVDITIKAVILAFRVFFDMPWTQICAKLGVPENTCLTIWKRAIEQTGDSPFGYDIHLLLATLHSKPNEARKPGPQRLIKPGSSEASAIRNEILYHEDLPLHEAASLANIPVHQDKTLARSTYKKVARGREYVAEDGEHLYRIVRGVRPKKLALIEDDEKKRREYSRWILDTTSQGIRVIFICSDEKWVDFGRGDRHKQKISRPEGASSLSYARAQRKPRFTVKIWAAACLDNRITRPFAVWRKEQLEDKEELKKLLEEADTINEERCQYHIEQAKKPGTKDWYTMEAINAPIRQHNYDLKASGHRGRSGYQRVRKPEHQS
jgi:hypothetical protein